jgi:hypothetical protein
LVTENKEVGIVFPVRPEHISRILDKHKDVFPKFISRIPKRPGLFRLKPGMKIIFYVSNSGRCVAGEAEIELIEFLPVKSAVSKYKNRLMLSQRELDEYADKALNRTEKPMLVLSFTKLRKYQDGMTYPRNVSMAGEYITQDKYEKIIPKPNTSRS